MTKASYFRSTSAFVILALAGVAPTAAWAEDKPAESAAKDEIIVTAQKRSQSLQSVPASIAVFNSDVLANAGVKSIDGLNAQVTGAVLARSGGDAQVRLRGIGPISFQPGIDAPVSFNIDGYDAPRLMTFLGLADIERVEILPGPQGTLYGGAASGGTVNTITRNPGKALAFSGSAEVGNFNAIHVNAGIDIPASDNLQFRLFYDRDSHDGYLSNGQLDYKADLVRGTIAAQPASNLKMNIKFTYFHDGGNGFGIPPAINAEGPKPYLYDTPPFQNFTVRPKADLDIYLLNGRLDWDLGASKLGDLTLSYVGGYGEVYNNLSNVYSNPRGPTSVLGITNATGPANVVGSLSTKRQTHELRLANELPGGISFLVGLWYENDKTTWTQKLMDLGAIGSGASFTVLTLPNPQLLESYAAFTQVTYPVTPGLRVTGGLRYSHDHKEVTGGQAFNAALPVNFNKSWDRADWKVGVEYDVAPDSLIYATAQSGYSRGGYNYSTLDANAKSAPVAPATATAYAVGTKNRFANGLVTLNAEGFYYDYRNYQVVTTAAGATGLPVYNVPKSRIYGVEGNLILRPTSDTVLLASATWMSAKYVDFPATVAARGFPSRFVDLSGADLQGSPSWTINLNARHTFRLGGMGKITAEINNHYSSSYWLDFSHGLISGYGGNAAGCDPATSTGAAICQAGVLQRSYWRSDAALTYAPEAGGWSLTAFVRNIQDKAIKDAVVATGGTFNASLAAPRTFGVRANFNF